MTQPQAQQASPPPADDNPRGAMPPDSYKPIDLEDLTPAERAAFEEAQRQNAAPSEETEE